MTTPRVKRPRNPSSEVIPKSRTKKILGRLDEDELIGLKIAVKVVNDMRIELVTKQRQLNVMEAGYNALTLNIRDKYNLPEHYSVDLQNGKLGAQGVF